MINKIQELQLKLMEQSSFNNFNGKSVVGLLKKNKCLWRSVLMDREDITFKSDFIGKEVSKRCIDLIKLRDLPDGFWNVDTLFILPEDGMETGLELFCLHNFGADEVEYISEKESGNLLGCAPFKSRILRVWWD